MLPCLRRALLPPLAASLLLGAAAPSALAHAAFRAASPAPGERVQDPPARVVLVFTEPLNPRLSQVRLFAASDGRALAADRPMDDRRRLVLVPRSPLARGAYRVTWRTVSTTDGHPLEGSYGFGVRAAPGATGSLQSSPLARGGWLRVAARTALYAALLLAAGGLLSQTLLGGRGSWPVPGDLRSRATALGLDVEAVAARSRSLEVDAGVWALGLAGAVAAVEAFTAAGRVSAATLYEYLLTGSAGLARIGVVAFAGLALALASRRPRLAALAAAGALACVTAGGHADSAQPRAVALAADFTHLLAGAVWLGGGAMLIAAWWPAVRQAGAPARREVARAVLARFGTIALPALVLVVLSGTVSALIELGHPRALWTTAYGGALMVKVALVAAIALAAYWHARRLRPRLLAAGSRSSSGADHAHWALLRLEPALGLAVVGAAALLVAFPLPPRQLDEAGGQALAVPACSPCPLPTPRPGELAVADLAGSRVVAGYLRRREGQLVGQVRLFDRRGRPAAARVSIPGAARSDCGRGCVSFTLAGAPARLRVAVVETGRARPVSLPARWLAGQEAEARRLLARAQRTMRALDSVRESELVTSGPGTSAVTHYRLRAPDRLAFSTGRGVQGVQIGRRQWLRPAGRPWLRRPDLADGLPFSTRSWFTWTAYAEAVQVVGVGREGGRPVAELALMDPGTPVWTRLWVDRASGRVLREVLVSRGRRATQRFFGFDSLVTVSPPPDGRG